jgi:uncharacterized iron-regulated membrane protein
VTFKKIILFFHRWLGIISGLVVFIVSITGCIFCFQDEIQDAIHPWRKVAIEQKAYCEPSVLKGIALSKYHGATAEYMFYFGKDRPAAVLANIPGKELTYIYLNPYSGQLLHTQGLKENFFTVVQYIHLYLLLPEKAGQLAVGISVIIFVILMITGIILWWPKRKTDRKRSFTIKWNGKWRRVNYDLHNVLGFYSVSIAIILAISGLSMTFEWVNRGIYNTANLGKTYAKEQVHLQSDSLKKSIFAKPAVDKAFLFAFKTSPKAEMFLIADPADKKGTINITAYAKSLHYGNNDLYCFDKYTGDLLRALPDKEKSPGMKLDNLNYDIHVGQVLGLTGKIIAFLGSLICASLPITGLIIWLGKKKKRKPSHARTALHKRTQHRLAYRKE